MQGYITPLHKLAAVFNDATPEEIEALSLRSQHYHKFVGWLGYLSGMQSRGLLGTLSACPKGIFGMAWVDEDGKLASDSSSLRVASLLYRETYSPLYSMLSAAMWLENSPLPITMTRKLRESRDSIILLSEIRFDTLPCTAMWHLLARVLTESQVNPYAHSPIHLLRFIPRVMPEWTYEDHSILEDSAELVNQIVVNWYSGRTKTHPGPAIRSCTEQAICKVVKGRNRKTHVDGDDAITMQKIGRVVITRLLDELGEPDDQKNDPYEDEEDEDVSGEVWSPTPIDLRAVAPLICAQLIVE
jgi:hypothetical protein